MTHGTQLKFDFWKEENEYICIKDTIIDYGGSDSKYNPVWKKGNIYTYKSGWDHTFVTSETEGGGYYINSVSDFAKVNLVKLTDYKHKHDIQG
jgi:hypothetical protein